MFPSFGEAVVLDSEFHTGGVLGNRPDYSTRYQWVPCMLRSALRQNGVLSWHWGGTYPRISAICKPNFAASRMDSARRPEAL